MLRLLRRLRGDQDDQRRDTAAFREELRRHRQAAEREVARLRSEPIPPAEILRQIRPWWEEAGEEQGR